MNCFNENGDFVPYDNETDNPWPISKRTSFTIEYTWTIDQFKETFANTNKQIKSPTFSTSEHDIEFKLELECLIKDNEKTFDLGATWILGETVDNKLKLLFDIEFAFLDKSKFPIKRAGK